jgi:anthranilate synthase/aminodeoxychorismate synthase-like glutamine amidotransferase
MIFVIDNYDSFTYNLVQLVLSQTVRVEVERNDAVSAGEILEREPEGIILSPGPGTPEDAGVCLDLFALRPVQPVLGVCLGHQVLGQAFGAKVGRAARLMHGKTSAIEHRGVGLFSGLPNPFTATRYHSLEVRESTLPDVLEPLAWSEDGILQGMRHRQLPYWGVQFHPESILTEMGPRLIENFLALCRQEGSENGG